MDLKPIEKLRPFRHFCMSIGELPSSYLESMTYAEMLMWFCDYLKNKVIPTIDNNALAVEELQALFVQLHDYVENYFDNLDVQDEINNKLDEMVEDGTLNNILMNYANVQKIYNTTIAMIEDADNLVNGMKIKTLGYYSVNDKGGADFVITNSSNDNYQIDLQNGLYAEMIIKSIVTPIQFGCVGDGSTNDITNLKLCFSSSAKIIDLLYNNYFIDDDYIEFSNKSIKGANSKFIIGKNVSATDDTFRIHGECFIDGLNVETVEDSDAKHVIKISNCKNSIFNDININVKKSQLSTISPIDINGNNHNLIFNNCSFIQKADGPSGGCWIRESETDGLTDNITFNNCIFEKKNGDEIVAVWGWHGTVKNIFFNNCDFTQFVSNTDNQYMLSLGQTGGKTQDIIIDNCNFKNYELKYSIIITLGSNTDNKNILIKNSNFEILGTADVISATHTIFGNEGSSINAQTYKNCKINGNNFQLTNYLFSRANVIDCEISNINIGDREAFMNCNIFNTIASITGWRVFKNCKKIVDSVFNFIARPENNVSSLNYDVENANINIHNNVFNATDVGESYFSRLSCSKANNFIISDNLFNGVSAYITGATNLISTNNIFNLTGTQAITMNATHKIGEYLKNDTFVDLNA